MQYSVYCPQCDHKLIIEEFTHNYVIKDGYDFHVVTSCPVCHIDLTVIDGELREDKVDNDV